jgi:hypothetical protein
MAGNRKGKRCMTQLDPDLLRDVTDLRERENRTESQMISVLVREAIAVRRMGAPAIRQAMPSDN